MFEGIRRFSSGPEFPDANTAQGHSHDVKWFAIKGTVEQLRVEPTKRLVGISR